MRRFAFRNWTVETRMIAVLLVASTLPVLLVGRLASEEARRKLTDSAVHALEEQALGLAHQIDTFHRQHVHTAMALAAFPPTVAVSEGTASPEEIAGLRGFADALLESAPELREIRVADPTGRIVFSTDARSLGLRNSPPLPAAEDATSVSEVFTSSAFGRSEPTIDYTARIEARGQLLGRSEVRVSAQGIGRVLGRGKHDPRQTVELTYLDGSPVGPYGSEPERPAALLRNLPGRVEVLRAGRPHVGVAVRLETVPWLLYCFEPSDELDSPADQLLGNWNRAGAIVALVALVIGLWLVRDFTRPLRELDAATQRVTAGDMTARLVALPGVEMQRLAERFDGMVASLEAGQGELERRVHERTMELEIANTQLRAQGEALESQRRDLAEQSAELAKTNAALERADRLKSQFLATMSHELRTPLNSILGFTQVVLDDRREPVTSSHRSHLEYVMRSGRHLLELINDTLDLSKIESGHLELERRALPVERALVEARDAVRSLLTRDNLELHVVCSTLRQVLADRRRLHQVLLNLLSNAIKFSPDGATIELVAEDDGEFVRFSVRDQGPGIDGELRARLFQPFAQSANQGAKRLQGTGLGLAICKHLVETHGGAIEATNGAGGGSVFSFTIPVALHVSTRTSVPRPELKTGPMIAAGVDKPRVLIVDDDEVCRTLLRGWLERCSYRVSEAESGERALAQACAEPPAVIMLDVQMPVMDGYQTLAALRANAITRTIPVVAITALAMIEEQAKLRAAGFDAYLIKPLQRQACTHTIAELAGLSA